jgi:hypothetical protein
MLFVLICSTTGNLDMDQRKRISAKEIAADIWNGLDDDALMTKFGLSRKQLEAVFKKLIAAGHVSQADLDARGKGPEELIEVEQDVPPLPVPDSRPAQNSEAAAYEPPNPIEPNSLSPSYTVRAAIGIIGGIVLQLGGAFVIRQGELLAAVGALIALGGTALLVWGCYNLVKKKGYHPALALLGIPWCFGVLLLLVMPNKNIEGASWKPAVVALVVVGVIGFVCILVLPIVLAIAVPYYVSYKRTTCDRMAAKDLNLFAAGLERLGNELGDASLPWDEESAGELASKNGIGYLVGPYYGWGGCSKQCGVLVRMTKDNQRWVAECAALKGAQPQGARSRYVYRQYIIGGKALPAKVTKNVIDAGNGQAQSWNSYPIRGRCYTDSLIQKLDGPDKASFTVKTPRSAPCEPLRVSQ